MPLTLIVCCSWVTFWLMKTDRGTEIPARTSLGATTVLSVVTIGFGGKSKPQVSKKKKKKTSVLPFSFDLLLNKSISIFHCRRHAQTHGVQTTI